jgi:transcriptional regulator with XRE-family HTH domain
MLGPGQEVIMSIDERLLLRNKILGALIRDARLTAGKTQKDCAALLGISPSAFSDIEYGERPVSLPELEAFATQVRVPVEHFFGDQPLQQEEDEVAPVDELLALRNRVVGVLLRQARQAAGMTQEECGQLIDAPDSRISAYEYGQMAVPLAELEILARALSVRPDTFLDSEHNPFSRLASQSQVSEQLKHLPEDLRAFLVDPVNIDYLRTARRLGSMPADQLRSIAETLLEITY